VTATPRKRFYHFSYLRQPATGGPLLHDLRDGDAFAELMPVLLDLGYEYGGLLLNHPPDPGVRRPQLGSEDLVVLTTRPPLDDPQAQGDRKLIKQSGNPLESAILKAARSCFPFCKRRIIQLSPDAAAGLRPGFADRGQMEFRVYRREEHRIPFYVRYRDPWGRTRDERKYRAPANPHATAVFLLRIPLRPGGPTLLNAFGMDGVMTLIWCYLLRTKFSHLLDAPGLTVAEIATPPLPPQPLSLSFADRWPVNFLIAPEAVTEPRP
jgi:hypothetical protein